MTDYKLTEESKKRMQIMVESTDGFLIAEEDLKLRGPGDIEGTQQSGIAVNFRLTKLGRDTSIIRYSHSIVSSILVDDPELIKKENQILKQTIKELFPHEKDWGTIS